MQSLHFNMKHKLLAKELFLCLIATQCIGFGVVLYIRCQLGGDSLTVFLDGINQTFSLSISFVDQILTFLFLIIAFFLQKKNVGLNTILYAFMIGTCISISQILLNAFNIENYSFTIKCFIIVFAQILFSFAFALLQNFKYGMSTLDALFYGIVEKYHLSYIYVHYIFDVTFFVSGYLLGGTIGIGSLFYVLSSSPLTYFSKKIIDYIIMKKQTF